MLLLPEQYPLVPFEEATGLLEDRELLRAKAEESGYLFFAGLLPPERIDPGAPATGGPLACD